MTQKHNDYIGEGRREKTDLEASFQLIQFASNNTLEDSKKVAKSVSCLFTKTERERENWGEH